MVTSESRIVRFRRTRFSYADACRIARRAVKCFGPEVIQLDLAPAATTTTAALAKLIILRRTLIARHSDLQLSGLHDQALAIYHFSRLEHVLPQT